MSQARSCSEEIERILSVMRDAMNTVRRHPDGACPQYTKMLFGALIRRSARLSAELGELYAASETVPCRCGVVEMHGFRGKKPDGNGGSSCA